MPFPVSCPACGKSFSIADDAYEQKIKGRVVSVKCKQCQGLIRVDGTKPPDAAARPSTPAEPAPSFLVDTPGGTDRELTATQIAEEFRAGRITETTLVWREGMAEWTEAEKVPELEPFLKPAEPPAEPSRRIRPMQPTLPMGMMAPPSLAARGITLPLTPSASAGSSPETVSVPLETRLPKAREDAPSRPKPASRATGSSPIAAAPAKAAASSPMAAPRLGSSPIAAQKPPSAPRALPIPTPLPHTRGSSPIAASAPPTFAEPDAAPPADPFADQQPAPVIPPYAPPSTFPAQPHAVSAYPIATSNFPAQAPRAGSAFPTTPAPPGSLPGSYGSYHPPAQSPVPKLPDSFPAAAPVEDLNFQPKLGKTAFIVIGAAIVAAIAVAVLASGGETPKPVPVPTAPPTAESRGYEPTPAPTPTPTPAPTPTSAAPDPLLNPNSAQATPQKDAAPNTGSEFTDLFARGAKKLGSARPAPPPPPQ